MRAEESRDDIHRVASRAISDGVEGGAWNRLRDRTDGQIPVLPGRQREVVLLRDVEGMSGEEVCAVLALSDANQRVLLHRGRSRLRQLFEDEFREVR